jgi:His/Glu/Gln/Arg/opine family amino acid ABC transporter permease subunit
MEHVMVNPSLIIESLPSLLKGALVTIEIAALGTCIGLFIGVLVGVGQASPRRIIALPAQAYAFLMRGTPMLIQILMIVYVLPQLGIFIPKFWGAILAIGLNSGAYISFIIKSGIQSIGKGTIEAAHVLGLSRFQTMRFIILPQALRVVLPALGNELVTLIKDSSLASLVGVVELTQQGRIIISQTYDALSLYCTVACIYLVLTTIVSLAVATLEQRMKNNARSY